MIYLDSAAVIKMLRREAETPELHGWLNERAATALGASGLVVVELPRTLRRKRPTCRSSGWRSWERRPKRCGW